MAHGYVGNWLDNHINYYDIFRYDKLIAQEALTDKHIIMHKSFDTTGLIYFLEFYASIRYRYRLEFLSPNHEGIILEFCIDDQLNLSSINMGGLSIF